MKLISKDGAISWLQFVADEVKPLPGYHLPTIVRAIAQRYEFAKMPTAEEANTTGANFRMGHFAAKKIHVAALGFNNNLLSVTTTDTNDSEIVLMDVYNWLKDTFGFRDPTTKPVRAFQSDLVVEFKNDPDQLLKSFAPFIKLLESELESVNGDKKPVQFNRIDFASDPAIPRPGMVFLVERRAGTPYAEKRFYCKAYMRTDRHIAALKMLDDLLGKKR